MVRFRVETIVVDGQLCIPEERLFLDGAVGFFRGQKADIIIPATTNAIFRTYPQQAKAAPYGTLVVDLTKTEDELWNSVHSKHRNVIRNAGKKGVEVRSGVEYLDQAHALIQETFKRSSMGFMDLRAFKKMTEGLGENVKVFVALYQGTIQGCAVVPFSLHAAYYVYGGTAAQPLTGATNLLQWEVMRYFRNQGVKRYDFCGVRIDPEKGSKQASLMMYKERFGPDLIQGYMWKCSLNPVKSLIYSLGVRLLRGGDIVDREHKKLHGPIASCASTALPSL
jgi:lipid II:glycine glycyltransferase (peptidoglycan interpeptide bridge formation enzyme)